MRCFFAAKRVARTHSKQQERYLEYLEEHRQMRTGAGDPQTLAVLWQRLTVELNSMGVGPQHDHNGWRKTMAHWKNCTRSKQRCINKAIGGTGGGPATKKQLNDLEERLLSLTSRVVVDGNKEVGYGDGDDGVVANGDNDDEHAANDGDCEGVE